MINPNHPRAKSLMIRDAVVQGVHAGITSQHGLIAQGRGEAFDYLLGEITHDFAKKSIRAAAAQLLLADFPVLSVNGNSAVLCRNEYAALSSLLQAPVEINLFHRSEKREKIIQDYLQAAGIKNIVGIDTKKNIAIEAIASKRKYMSQDGIVKADVVFVPLEDGDRTEALTKMGKKVITIDLNPFSRTAQFATITIVDNIVRCFPLLVKETEILQKETKKNLEALLFSYDNQLSSTLAKQHMNRTLTKS